MGSVLQIDPVVQGFPWHFRGEGNSSVVLYSETLPLVLRLRKVLLTRPDAAFELEKHTLRGIVEYVECVIKPLVASESWIPNMTVVELKDRFVELLEEIRAEREPMRLRDPQTFHDEAILMPDLTFIPETSATGGNVCFSIELKPKEGIMPSDPRAHPLRRKYSKFALKQLMKAEEGIITNVTRYDPVDLFSGDTARMKKALHHLITNPQNNLRVFVDGALAFGSSNAGHDTLEKALQPFFDEEAVNAFVDLVIDALNWSSGGSFSILAGLWDAQALCEVDIEPLYPQYVRICRLFAERQDLRRDLGVDGPNYKTAPFWTGMNLETFDICSEDINAIAHLRNYLTSATLKDCSVFITFRVLPNSDHMTDFPVIIGKNGLKIAFHASLVDLDPKPFERIERHYIEAMKLIQLAEQMGLE